MRDECDNELVGCRTNTSSSLSTRYVLSVMFLLFTLSAIIMKWM